MRVIVIAWLVSLVACTPALVVQSPPTQNVAAVNAAGTIMVKFEKQSCEVLQFVVLNGTDKMLVVNRDAVVLQTPRGTVAREPGGLSSVYNLRPGKLHGLKVRFPISDLLDGEQVDVLFNEVFMIEGQPIAVAPLQFVVAD